MAHHISRYRRRLNASKGRFNSRVAPLIDGRLCSAPVSQLGDCNLPTADPRTLPEIGFASTYNGLEPALTKLNFAISVFAH
jgi:hypothetical protein